MKPPNRLPHGRPYRAYYASLWPAAEKTVPAALVLERDAVLRNVIRTALNAQGFEVLDAASLAEAYALRDLLLNPPVDLLILDHTMAATGTPQHMAFAEQLFALAPGIKVLVISDCPYQIVAEERGIPENGWFLQKPFTTAQFVEIIKNIFEPRIQ
jgi:DNA-binding NtrC family response regulator